MPARILKILIITCRLILLGLLAQRDFSVSSLGSNKQAALIRTKHEQYYDVYLTDIVNRHTKQGIWGGQW